jgi:hypothetical protein
MRTAELRKLNKRGKVRGKVPDAKLQRPESAWQEVGSLKP